MDGYSRIDAFCICAKGNQRNVNQDNFVFAQRYREDEDECRFSFSVNIPEKGLDFGVFDGLGGLFRSELASELAAHQYLLFCQSRIARDNPFFQKAVSDMHKQICKLSANIEHKCGSTAALLFVNENNFYAANVGDSRIYLYRKGLINQLSKDHTDWQVIENLNLNRNPELIQYLGMEENEFEIEPHITHMPLNDGDIFLICSDGFISSIEPSALMELFAIQDPVHMGDNLNNLFSKINHKDDATAILCKFSKEVF